MNNYFIKEISVLGNITAGNNVVPFIPRGNKKIHIPVKASQSKFDIYSYEVTGDSLIGDDIKDGAYLSFRDCSIYEVRPEKIYIVFIVTTGELIARHVLISDEGITLRGSNPDYADRTFDPDEIEIRGLVLYYTYDAP
jgi:SOS-response transcriptional repressor LexA